MKFQSFSADNIPISPGYDVNLHPVVRLQLGSAEIFEDLEQPLSLHCSLVHPDRGDSTSKGLIYG